MTRPAPLLAILIAALTGFALFIPFSAADEFSMKSSAVKTDEMGGIVVRVHFANRDQLNTFAGSLDIWEVHHDDGYVLAYVRADQYADMVRRGYRVEADDQTIGQFVQPLPGQTNAIPGYPCYRTVEESLMSMHVMESQYPNLVSILDIGDSWEKIVSGGSAGYDLSVMVLSNKSTPGPKPRFFLLAETHAREYVTAETALRFAEHLLAYYGTSPDITWLLDFSEVHILALANPDGRKKAEAGVLWRKNTDNDDGCTDSYYWGTDLNRNYGFKWGCCGGSSEHPCDATYRGPSPASEPEVQAIQQYAALIFDDQRGTGDTDAAPENATGLLVTLHSYGELVLWPWGWTPTPSPNAAQLQTLGRKLAYFNNHVPQQAYNLYTTDGSTDDWAYGVLGIAAYTFEMGTAFFEKCSDFEETIYPLNRDALMYAFKAARNPYEGPAGPDSVDVTVSSSTVMIGTIITVTATANDARYSPAGAVEPYQNIAAAQFSVNSPSWIEGTVVHPMSAADGAFNSPIENIVATIDTTGWPQGRHTIFLESQDEEGNWGVPTAFFLTIVDHLSQKTRVRIIPKRISFGKIITDSATPPRTVTITNRGKDDMEIISVAVSGPHQSDFLLTHDCTGQFPPGGSCSATVTVHPSATGRREAGLIISSNDARKPLKSVRLKAYVKEPTRFSETDVISPPGPPQRDPLPTASATTPDKKGNPNEWNRFAGKGVYGVF